MAYEQRQESYKCHEERCKDGAKSINMMLLLRDAHPGFMNGPLGVGSEENFGPEEGMDNTNCRHLRSKDC